MLAQNCGETAKFKRGAKVIDHWWPERRGIVCAITPSRIVVRWSDGGEWRYDRAHCQFLETTP
jgi:hypothetical protein